MRRRNRRQICYESGVTWRVTNFDPRSVTQYDSLDVTQFDNPGVTQYVCLGVMGFATGGMIQSVDFSDQRCKNVTTNYKNTCLILLVSHRVLIGCRQKLEKPGITASNQLQG